MIKHFENALCQLLRSSEVDRGYHIFDPASHLRDLPEDGPGLVRVLNAAFLVAMAGRQHPAADRANQLLNEVTALPKWSALAAFYQDALREIRDELAEVGSRVPEFALRLRALSEWVDEPNHLRQVPETQEWVWSVFFPEATGIRRQENRRVETLREKRHVTVTQRNDAPLGNPAREVLFTSNALLTVPSASTRLDDLGLGDRLTERIGEACQEPQLFWYDHPIPIGVEAEANEVLYGLRGLQSALEFERARGSAPHDARLTCALSVSVTHRGLQGVAKQYLAEELDRAGGFQNLDVFVFTEEDARRIVDQVLVPAAEHYLRIDDVKEQLGMFGVDGHYGRHYSFLKAIAAFWAVLIDPQRRATFKIDLDQVFPQQQLVDESNRSAFEHLTTPLWGARGTDTDGRHVELGMIAGALVNESDIEASLFTPDVRFPTRQPALDECVFFSGLPQALSTFAEMMTRYETNGLDGKARCIHRIHVTGGTNGILVDSLRRHRPFTPSFMGRAEDQAYILSALFGGGERLAYAHQPGLIMRHDKEAFAQEAIAAAHVGKLIGDYERILYFSAYADVLGDGIEAVKNVVDPFTGGFVSRIPTTLVYLRFALKCESLFESGEIEQATEFTTQGVQRISQANAFTRGDPSELERTYAQERRGWDVFYDTLDVIEKALNEDDPFAIELRKQAEEIVHNCEIKHQER